MASTSRIIAAVMILITIAMMSATVHADAPLRGPYLQNLTSESVEVLWTSTAPGASQLRFFGAGRWKSIASNSPQTRHRLVLPLDRCETPCRYRVGVRGKRLSRVVRLYSPATHPEAVTVLALGDSGDGGEAQYAVAQALRRERAPILLHLGDLVYPKGLDEDYDSQFFAPYKSLLPRTTVYPVLGNHDAFNVDVFRGIFSLSANGSESDTERYYSFSYGPLHGIALDSNSPLTPGSAQLEWLRVDLGRVDRTTTPWIVVFFHHPLYSSGSHGGSVSLRGALEELLEHAGVRLILTGHDHDYERSEPGPRFGGKGIVHIVSGGGGNPKLSSAERENGTSRVFAAEHHYLKLRLSPKRLTLEAIRPDGSRIDYRVLTHDK